MRRSTFKRQNTGFWSRLAKSKDLWEEDDRQKSEKEIEQNSGSCKLQPKYDANRYHSPTWIIKEAKKSKRILIITTICFFLLLCIGLTISLVLRSNIIKEFNNMDISDDMDRSKGNNDVNVFEMNSDGVSTWFTNELEKALYPLFILQQYVIKSSLSSSQENNNLMNIPYQMENAPSSNTGQPYHLNVNGICNNPLYVIPFHYMTIPYSNITTTTETSSTLFMELWPASISCFSSPFKEYMLYDDNDDSNNNSRSLFDTSFIDTQSPTSTELLPTTTTESPTKTFARINDTTTNAPNPSPFAIGVIMDISEFESDFDTEKPSVKEVPPTQSPIIIPVENTEINPSSSDISNEIVYEKIIPSLSSIISNNDQPIITDVLPIDNNDIMNNIDTNIVGKDYKADPTSANEINEILTSCPYDKSIMNGPYRLSMMDENNNTDPTLNTTTNTNYTKVFIASTPIPYMNNISSRRLQNNNNQWGIATIVLDWNTFVKNSDMHLVFQQRNLDFILKDKDDNIIEQSSSLSNLTTPITSDNSISYNISIVNNEWNLIIISSNDNNYNNNNKASSSSLHKSVKSMSSWMIAIVVLTSIVISILLLIVLVDQQEQQALLTYLLPYSMIARVHRNEMVIERYQGATVFVSQIIGFTALTGQVSPVEVITLLNEIYDVFDSLVAKHGLVKVETMGDVYVVIGGGPELHTTSALGAEKVAAFSIDVLDFVGNFKVEEGLSVYVRVGLATGHIIAGVIGSINKKFPKYSLFGDLLNWASLLQSTSKKMRIQTSETTHNLLTQSDNYNFKIKERTDGGGVVLSDIAVPDVSSRTFWLTAMTPKNE